MTTQTQIMTTCDGQIGINGFCNKCGQPAMTTGNSCGRLIPVQPVKQQTPLQKLIEFMDITPYVGNEIYDKAKSLLAEEKQMVIDAYCVGESDGQNMAKYSDHYKFETGEQYFNETYQ